MRKRKEAEQSMGYGSPGKVHKENNRFGDFTLTFGEYKGHYQTLWFEGRPDPVFWVIGQWLNDTSHCYEHTFQVRKVEASERGDWNKYQWVKVECERTSYVGD